MTADHPEMPSGDTEAPEIAQLRAEKERLRTRAEQAEHERDLADEANQALEEKLHSLAPHGSCACSYDRPGDVCMHHSPKLAAAEAALEDSKRRVAELEGNCPDGVRMVPSYIAQDGSTHHSIRSAVERNESVVRTQAATNLLAAGASVWEAARAWSLFADPQLPDVLKRITKDTPLIISHWQCRDEPGYKVCRFEEDGHFIFVGGDAGSWSGTYGSKITLLDLARYAEDTLKKHPNLATTPTQEASHVEG